MYHWTRTNRRWEDRRSLSDRSVHFLSSILFFLCFFGSFWKETKGQSAPFSCNERIYFFRQDSTGNNPNGTLSYIEGYRNDAYNIVDQCPMQTFWHNSLGANPVDGFMYYTDSLTLCRLDANCHSTPVCDLPFLSFSGSFDREGNYWTADYYGSFMYVYNVKTCQIVKGPFPLPETIADIAYNLFDCHLYIAGSGGSVYKMDTLGNIVSIFYYGGGEKDVGAPGGLVIGADNKLYALQGFVDSQNNAISGGYFYRINTDQYDATLIYDWKKNNGPSSGSRLDLASFPCFQNTIDPVIVPDRVTGCWPLRVSFYGQASSIPDPNVWTWDFGDGSKYTDTTREMVHTFLNPGTYQVKMIAGLVSDCGTFYEDSTTVTITVLNKPSVFLYSPVSSVCEGDEVVLEAKGSTSYTWSTGETGASIKVHPTTTTTYIVTGYTGNNGCKASDTVTIEAVPKPILESIPSAKCADKDDAVTLEVIGATYYVWSDGFEGAKRGVYISETTKYKVTGYNSSSCYDTTSVVATVYPMPLLNRPVKRTYCAGDTLFLSSFPGVTSSWYNPGGAFIGLDSTKYPLSSYDQGVFVVYMSNNQCYSKDTFSVDVKAPILSFGLPHPNLCVGNALNLAVNLSPFGSLSSFSWQGPNMSSSSFPIYLPHVTAKDSGYYKVTGVAEGCKISDSILVAVHANPDSTILSSSTTFCSHDGIQMEVAEGNQYAWSGPDGFVSDSNAVARTPATSVMKGKYSVVITNMYGCQSQASVVVDVKQSPEITLKTGPIVGICEGRDLDMQVQVSPPTASLVWSGPNSFASSSSTIHIAHAQPSDGGEYVVSATENGCTSRDSILSIVDQQPDSIIYVLDNRDTICESSPNDIQLYYASSVAHELDWYKVGNSTSLGNDDMLVLDKPDQTGAYYAVVESAHSYCPPKKTNVDTVKIYQQPWALFSQDAITVNYAPGLKVPIPLAAIGAGVDSVTFLGWSPDTWLEKKDTLYPVIVSEPHQKFIDYTLTLKTGVPGAECLSEFVFHFFNLYPVIVPNAFSPNGDKLNDVWIIQGLDWYPYTRVYVYNRWGNKIYENENGYLDPWDGNFHGKELATGTYYYLIELRGSQDRTDHILSGSLTIVR